jgi:NADP-dependent 3-hydroxy acid dehydrogenase YdfG
MTDRNNGIALVTGASSGIGLVTAQALARAGYRVFGTSRKS